MNVQQRIDIVLTDNKLSLLKKEVGLVTGNQKQLVETIRKAVTENGNIEAKVANCLDILEESSDYLYSLTGRL